MKQGRSKPAYNVSFLTPEVASIFRVHSFRIRRALSKPTFQLPVEKWRRFQKGRLDAFRHDLTRRDFRFRNYEISSANLPDTVAGSKLRTYSSVADSFAGWLTIGLSLAIPPSFPGSDSYCCLLKAILVNNSFKRVCPVVIYILVTPRTTEF